MALARIPRITWGTGFVNTLDMEGPFDSPSAYSEPREGSEFEQSTGGTEDAWITGTDQVLEAEVRWIPTSDSADPVATGWDGATGWRAFLEWARQKNIFRLIPDKTIPATYWTCYLVDPMKGAPPLEDDGSRKLRLRIRSSDGSVFTGY